jgi:uncharacterized protein
MKKISLLVMLAVMLTLIAVENEIQTVIEEETEFQTIEMSVDRHGWTPNSFVLKKGIPVKWEINAKELTYCNETIVIPDFDMKVELQKGEQVIEFTPKENGKIIWSCWMDMIPGKFIVTENGKEIENKIEESKQKPKGCCAGKK